MPKTRPPYSDAFREQMVALVHAGRKPEEMAAEFEPSAESIRQRVKRAAQDTGSRSYVPPAAEALGGAEWEELVRLRRENRQLKLEREILAMAAAWFARETNSIPSSSL